MTHALVGLLLLFLGVTLLLVGGVVMLVRRRLRCSRRSHRPAAGTDVRSRSVPTKEE